MPSELGVEVWSYSNRSADGQHVGAIEMRRRRERGGKLLGSFLGGFLGLCIGVVVGAVVAPRSLAIIGLSALVGALFLGWVGVRACKALFNTQRLEPWSLRAGSRAFELVTESGRQLIPYAQIGHAKLVSEDVKVNGIYGGSSTQLVCHSGPHKLSLPLVNYDRRGGPTVNDAHALVHLASLLVYFGVEVQDHLGNPQPLLAANVTDEESKRAADDVSAPVMENPPPVAKASVTAEFIAAMLSQDQVQPG